MKALADEQHAEVMLVAQEKTQRKKFGSRYLVNEEDVWNYNAWYVYVIDFFLIKKCCRVYCWIGNGF